MNCKISNFLRQSILYGTQLINPLLANRLHDQLFIFCRDDSAPIYFFAFIRAANDMSFNRYFANPRSFAISPGSNPV